MDGLVPSPVWVYVTVAVMANWRVVPRLVKVEKTVGIHALTGGTILVIVKETVVGRQLREVGD